MTPYGTYSIQTVAALFNMGSNTLFAEMRKAEILNTRNLPFARYNNHFIVKDGWWANETYGQQYYLRAFLKTKSLPWLADKLGKTINTDALQNTDLTTALHHIHCLLQLCRSKDANTATLQEAERFLKEHQVNFPVLMSDFPYQENSNDHPL